MHITVDTSRPRPLNPPQPSGVWLQCDGSGFSHGDLRLLHVSQEYLFPPLTHQEGMVARPEFGRPAERHDKVPCDHVGRRLICPCGPRWVKEGNPGLFDRQSSDLPNRDIRIGPLKEVREKDVMQRIIYPLECHPYSWDYALHKGPLLLEGLMQACICGLWMLMRHPVQGGHWLPSALHFLPQPTIPRRLLPHDAPKAASPCHNL